MQSGLFLDVVVSQGVPISQLFPCKDQPLLVRVGGALFDLGLGILDGVAGLHLQGDGLTSQGLHEDLHPTSEVEDQIYIYYIIRIILYII